MSNSESLAAIFARSQEVVVCGQPLTLNAPSAENAAKIETAQLALADYINPSGEAKMSKEALKANKAYNQLCIEAVLGISADEAKRLMVVAPQVINIVNDFLGSAPEIAPNPS